MQTLQHALNGVHAGIMMRSRIICNTPTCFTDGNTLSYIPKMELKDVLKKLMEREDVGPYDLEARTGVNQPTIHRILTGESKDPRKSTLEPLAQYFCVSLPQLRGEDPLPEINESISSTAAHAASLPKEVRDAQRAIEDAWTSGSVDLEGFKALRTLLRSLKTGQPMTMRGTPEQEEAQRAASNRLADKLKASNPQPDQDKDTDPDLN